MRGVGNICLMTDSARRVLIDYLTSVKPQLDDVLLPEKNAEFFGELSTVGDAFFKLGARRWADAYLALSNIEHDTMLTDALKGLGPWRKGPFDMGPVTIDAEWRGDLKWDRFADFLPDIGRKRVLDVGASNGYYMRRLAERGPRLVLGLDPAHRAFFQFLAVQKYDPQPACVLVPTVWKTLAMMKPVFDLVLCLGVVYHQHAPLDMLVALHRVLQTGGMAVVESIVIPGEGPLCLVPPGRYCQMKNIYFIPTVSTLQKWMWDAGFTDVQCVSVTRTTSEEQRRTAWSSGQSLADFLDPQNPDLSIEGHPAPRRAIVIGKKAG